jgi:hypothetical protein
MSLDHFDKNGHGQSHLEYLSKQVDYLRTVISALFALLVVSFGGGLIWAKLQVYEQKVDTQENNISDLKKSSINLASDEATAQAQGKSIGTIQDDILSLKKNLSDLGLNSLYSDKEVLSEGETLCEPGGVIIGLVHKGSTMFIRCSSVGRAVWNRESSGQGLANSDWRTAAGH